MILTTYLNIYICKQDTLKSSHFLIEKVGDLLIFRYEGTNSNYISCLIKTAAHAAEKSRCSETQEGAYREALLGRQ